MLSRLLPESARARRGALYAAVALATALVTQLVLPMAAGNERGTPVAILFQGLVTGLVISLFATGVVLLYRTMRFINFALGTLGVAGSVLASYFLVFTKVPFPVVVVLALAVSGGIGAIAGVFLLRFLRGSRLFLTVVTIVGSGFLILGVSTFVARLPFWPAPNRLSRDQIDQLRQLDQSLPLRGFHFRLGGFPLRFGFNHLFAIELALVALVALAVFLRYTRTGAAVRAMAANPERASLLGIGVGGLTVLVWAIAGILDGVADLASAAAAPLSRGGGTAAGGFDLAVLLLPLAAAVLARFEDLGTTVFAAVVLGVLQEAFAFSYPRDTQFFSLFLFLLIAAGLLAQRRKLARSEAAASVSWSATDEPRAVPKELAILTGVRVARLAIFATVGVTALALPLVLTTSRLFLASVILVNAIAVLSLVVLTGWAGQVSLGQYGLVAVGSVVGGALTSRVGVPFWFAVPLTAALTAGIAVLVGLPALRIKGLFLLVVTFGFAVAVSSVLFDERYFGWLLPKRVDRPTLFFLRFESERSMYYLSLGALVLCIVAVGNLRRSRVGRLLIALRESEANVQSFGVSVVRLKLLAFAIAGGMAGFAGAIFAHQQRGVSAGSFTPTRSVVVFVSAVIGGVSSPGGALLGSAYTELVNEFTRNTAVLAAFFGGVGPLLVLFMAPGGFISLVNAARDSVLRIVAQRRQIVVPSLFADLDADAIEHRLAPLGEAQPSSGLGALPPTLRFTLSSELYLGRGERIVDRLTRRRATEETVVLGAAARKLDELEQVDRGVIDLTADLDLGSDEGVAEIDLTGPGAGGDANDPMPAGRGKAPS